MWPISGVAMGFPLLLWLKHIPIRALLESIICLSIEIARKRATEQGLGNENRLRFITAQAASFPRCGEYDLVTFFDCFHDMGNPFAVARHVKDVPKPDGTLMLVEDGI